MRGTVLSQPSSDVFTTVTAKILAAMEAGAGEYKMPWHGAFLSPAFPLNAVTGKPYRGVNIIALWAEAMLKRYISGYWASYRQWQDAGAQVRKGERGAAIVFYKKLDQEPDEGGRAGEGSVDSRWFVARTSHVFNAEQVDGWQAPTPQTKSSVERNEEIAALLTAVGAEVRHGGFVACYRRDIDVIEMPEPSLFIGTATCSPTESYHAVLLHETVHWTGAPHRLDREFGKRFGDAAYAFEELVAELGAAFLCSAFRISNEPRPDHAAYLSSWLQILRSDTKAIFTAASKAQEAVEYLFSTATERAQSA